MIESWTPAGRMPACCARHMLASWFVALLTSAGDAHTKRPSAENHGVEPLLPDLQVCLGEQSKRTFMLLLLNRAMMRSNVALAYSAESPRAEHMVAPEVCQPGGREPRVAITQANGRSPQMQSPGDGSTPASSSHRLTPAAGAGAARRRLVSCGLSMIRVRLKL